MSKSLDRIDRRILSQLQQDCSVSNKVLAELVDLSPAACLRRVQRLRDQGVIAREVALLNPAIAGPQLHVLVEVELERDRQDLYDAFRRRIVAAPEVTQCYRVTGEVDFMLVVTVSDMPAYDDFLQRVLYTDPNLRKFRSLISLSRDKFDTAIPLD